MWPRFRLHDLHIIAHYLGALILLVGAAMLIPLAVACVMQDWQIAFHYLIGIGTALIVGSILRMFKIAPSRLDRRQAIAVTGLAWIVAAVIAAIPLWLSGHYVSFLDAFFEGVSGITATGLSMIQDVDHLSTADNMWRFCLQFIGGQGVVVIALSLGLFAKGGPSLYNAEGRDEHVLPGIKQTARFIWTFSFMVISAGTIILMIVAMVIGIEPLRAFFHGLWITIGSYDTGGFNPQSTSMMYYHSWAFEVFAMLLMFLGAINFTLYGEIRKGRWVEVFKNIETKTLALWTTFMVAIFIAALCAGEYLTDYSALLRRGIFTIVSATTNSGYQVLTNNQMTTMLTSGAFFMIALAMSIGGSAGSTAGGIKAMRVGIIVKAIVAKIKSVLSPDSARITSTYYHAGKRPLTNELVSSAMVIAALYVITYIVGALVGIAAGYDAIPAIFESISATSNAGLSSGIIAPEAPVFMKVVYILQMWMGRLEFLTLLALLVSIFVSVKPRKKVKA